MSKRDKVWVGIDPGGKGNFGVVILGSVGVIHRCSVSFADEAIEVICKHVVQMPAGVGVDAPLWLSSGLSGLRKADEWIRKQYNLPSRHVQAVNSLWGAVIAQGLMFVQRMRERFPGVNITEVHPKVLINNAMGLPKWSELFAAVHTDIAVDAPPKEDHERDALIAAIAAREGFCGHWQHDLALLAPLPGEQSPSERWLRPVHYFWPE